MAYMLFLDESGQDRRNSPYEVLAGIAVEDRNIWSLINAITDLQKEIFGIPLYTAYGAEAKATKLLKRKVFKHANQSIPIDPAIRQNLAREILEDGTRVSRERLSALAQAKLAYCEKALELVHSYGCQAFASIVSQNTVRPTGDLLRRDYVYLFERFYYFLNSKTEDPMGFLVFDELDKSSSHILLTQVSNYFLRTQKGRTRSRLIIPEPIFVHSDLTTMIQLADLLAYTISWGVRLRNMTEPARNELSSLARLVCKIRFRQETPSGRVNWGFKYIEDLGQ